MFENIASEILIGLIVSILGTLIGAIVVNWWRARNRIRIETTLEPGPTSVQYGFTETAVTVTIKNESGNSIEIQDIRLIFCGVYGIGVLPEAPKPRSHPQLPALVEHGTTETWYFPGSKLAILLQHYRSERVPREKKARLRPRVTATTGKIYKGPAFRFSLDYNSYWTV